MIVNLSNEKFYVGSAMKNRLYIRFTNHIIYCTGSDIIAKAVEKYGLDNFVFIVLKYTDPYVSKKNNDELLKMETEYLELLNPPYNILKIGGSSFGYKHSQLTKEKMKANYSQERRDLIGNLNKGKILPEEIREKFRAAAYRRPPMSVESRKKCITNNKPVIAYSLDGSIYRKEESMIKLASYFQVSQKTLRLYIKSGKYLKNK